MKTYIALLRGINIIGSRLLPMKELKLLFEQNGCIDVQTYIQSGNVIFRCARPEAAGLATQLTAAIARSRGFQPRMLLLTLRDLEGAARGNPFRDAEQNPTSLHLFFLSANPPSPDLESLRGLQTKTERFALKGKVFYLHTPDGFGSSRLAKRVERLLGIEATARNWRTVTTLLEMAGVSSGRGRADPNPPTPR
jgi:uncharacterized protein (DUF1697 family)